MGTKLFFSILLFISVFPVNAYSQSIRVSGRVTDDTGRPLPNCTVMLYTKTDSTFMSGSLSDGNGLFAVRIDHKGSCFLEVSILGFDKHISLLEVQADDILMGDILLKESVIGLSEITVTASKNEIEFSPGMATVNLSSLIIKAGSNMLDILKTLPGVVIREDGTVLLNGQTGAQITVDGKPTYLSGENLINLLHAMPSASVSKVELITHPPARYDAAGNSGIINLYTERFFFRGTRLSSHTRYTQGKYAAGDMGFNWAFREGDVCFFADYSYYRGKAFNDLQVLREELDFITREPLNQFMHQHTYRKWRYDSHYYRIGLDYDISPNTYLGIYSTGFIMDRRQDGNIKSEISGPVNSVMSQLITYNRNNKYPRSYSGGVNLSYSPWKETEWNNYFDLIYHSQPENQFQYDEFHDFDTGQQKKDTLKGRMGGKIHIYAGESNLTFLLNKSKVRAGLKTSFISVDNSALYHNRYGKKWVENASLSRQFSYHENINTAYVQVETIWMDKFSTQIGLRMENTNVKGNIASYAWVTDSSYSHQYTHLFPSVTLEYRFRNGNSVSALYSRRIKRPDYNEMNPFVYIFDNYMYEKGNPGLKPSLSDNIELSFALKNKMKASFFLLRLNDPISKSFHLEENNRILVYPDNLSSGYSYGVRLNSAMINVAQWWKISANLTLNYKKYSWLFSEKEEKLSVFSPYAGLNNRFVFAKNWTAEVSLSYQGKNADGQYYFKPVFLGDAGIRRQILKGNGTISFIVDDMFESNLLKGKVQMPGRLYTSRERELGRLFRISFTYRFQRGKEAKESDRKRGIEESDRL